MSSPLTKPASPWAVKIAQEGKDQGLPHKKIRQKLVLQGLEPELIDNVLNGDMDSSGRDQGPLEPSSPPTSPMRRQVSTRKFHDMLETGISPAAVRQKMAMAGCPPEEIKCFFATHPITTKVEEQEVA
ncbi:unnamed protein product [Ascophyllum nodosum]